MISRQPNPWMKTRGMMIFTELTHSMQYMGASGRDEPALTILSYWLLAPL